MRIFKHLAKRTRAIKRKAVSHALAFTPISKIVKNRRAINAVISNIILMGAVIVVGLVVLYWSQSQSASYQAQYSGIVNDNVNQVQEKIVFEFVGNCPTDPSKLNVYVINSGTVGDVTIKYASINSVGNTTDITLFSLGDTHLQISSLSPGAEGYFSIDKVGSSPYIVKIITGRGSTFASTS